MCVADPDGSELATQEDVPDNRRSRDVSSLANSLKSALEADDDNGNRRDVDADTLRYLSGWIQRQLPSSLNRVTELKVVLHEPLTLLQLVVLKEGPVSLCSKSPRKER